ncbi:hypothetical protein CCACVL1_29373, partial [Corchorus capsularis]
PLQLRPPVDLNDRHPFLSTLPVTLLHLLTSS